MILSKIQAKVAAYVHKALSNDPARPVLGHVVVRPEQGYAASADGWRLHAVPASIYPVDEGLNGKDFHGRPVGKTQAGATYILTTGDEDGQYPDLGCIINSTNLTLAISPKFLIDALSGLDGTALIRINVRVLNKHDEPATGEPASDCHLGDVRAPIEVVGQIYDKESGENIPTYALIMPVSLDSALERMSEPGFKPKALPRQ